MTKAAVPNYMNKHLAGQDIAPGHRFGLYFPVWKDDWSKAENKTDALKKATHLPNSSRKLAENLHKRQQALALQNPELGYFPAKSTSPFMTGIGNEHPLENGFAFLNPYGLPYLPGSGVKGILRTVAEELALGLYGETQGWDMLAVWWLFGFDTSNIAISQKTYKGDAVLLEEAERRQQAYRIWLEKGEYDREALNRFINAVVSDKSKKEPYKNDPTRFLTSLSDEISLQGALRFWDVYPQSKELAMGILTPHHGGYFTGKNAPHDSEQPVPNVFLTIPSGSSFDFYCSCQTARLPASLRRNWQALIGAAFEHAFDWLGFGAKTAVGYGQMRTDADAEKNWNTQKDQVQKKQKLENEIATLSPIAQNFVRNQSNGNWKENKDAFFQNGVIENWLDQLQQESDEVVIKKLIELFDKHFPGLLENPDKVQGKKQKPVFSDRQRKLAKALKLIQSGNK